MSREGLKLRDLPPASLSAAQVGQGAQDGTRERLSLLERENLRLQRLAAELLMKNQQLRERVVGVDSI